MINCPKCGSSDCSTIESDLEVAVTGAAYIGSAFLGVAALFTGGLALTMVAFLGLPLAGAAAGKALHNESGEPDFHCNRCTHSWKQ